LQEDSTEGNTYEELIQFNNHISLKSRFEQVDQDLKKLSSKIKFGLEKFDLTSDQRQNLFLNLLLIYSKKSKHDLIEELFKDKKNEGLFNQTLVWVGIFIWEKKFDEAIELIGNSHDVTLSIFKAQAYIG